jgi:hypothetical protein
MVTVETAEGYSRMKYGLLLAVDMAREFVEGSVVVVVGTMLSNSF